MTQTRMLMQAVVRLFIILSAGLLVFAVPAQAAIKVIDIEKPAKRALIFGNSNYSEVMALKNPENDARVIGSALGKLGFEITLHTNLGYADMRRAVARFRDKIGPLDTIVFFYAGHGFSFSGNDYLVATDARADDSRSADTLINQSLALNYVVQSLDKTSGPQLFFIDGDRSNPFKSAGTRGFAVTKPVSGKLLFFSSEEGNVAMDGDADNSPFTVALVKAIGEPGLEINDLVRRVSEDVFKTTAGQQRPQWVLSLREPFYFIGPDVKTSASEKKLNTSTTQCADGSDDCPQEKDQAQEINTALLIKLNELKIAREKELRNLDREERFWRQIKESKIAEEIEIYLKKYPDGLYVDLARIRVAKLRKTANAANTMEPAAKPANQSFLPVKPLDKRVALVIGNANYENQRSLTNPPKDAKALVGLLKLLGFEVDEAQIDLTKVEMDKALQLFARKARSADVSLIYYSGHGIEVGGTNYLLPVDAKLETDQDVDFEAVSLDIAIKVVHRSGTLGVVLLDACRDNPFLPKMKILQKGTKSVSKGLARITEQEGLLIGFAAAAGMTADDGDGEFSPYVEALLKNLPTPGKDIELVLRKVRDHVKNSTGGTQVPHKYGSMGGKEYHLVPVL